MSHDGSGSAVSGVTSRGLKTACRSTVALSHTAVLAQGEGLLPFAVAYQRMATTSAKTRTHGQTLSNSTERASPIGSARRTARDTPSKVTHRRAAQNSHPPPLSRRSEDIPFGPGARVAVSEEPEPPPFHHPNSCGTTVAESIVCGALAAPPRFSSSVSQPPRCMTSSDMGPRFSTNRYPASSSS